MINAKTIEDAVYNSCVQANTILSDDVFTKILDAYNSEENSDAKQALGLILENAKLAYDKKMPLCQDTGQVLVFVSGSAKYIPDNINAIINNAVSKAYEENFYRKSVVKNAVFDRTNTKTNTPCIIYTEISDSEDLEIELLLKGGGSENVCSTQMLSPTATEDEITEFVVSTVKKAGAKACPPYFVGVGIGGTMEYAGILSKKALLLEKNIDENHKNLAEKIKNAVNELKIGAAGLGGASTALDVKILTNFTHIACMPCAVAINCHSTRHAKCIINKQGIVEKEAKRRKGEKAWKFTPYASTHPRVYASENDYIKVHTSDVQTLKSLKQGQNVLLSGEIYTARDMAHKRLVEMIEKGEKLPFDLKDKIIFYAGPCPCSDECVVGSIGPTTSARMDKFAPILYKHGVLATIGKGERSEEVKKVIKQVRGIYFTTIGGIACYLSGRIVSRLLLGFEEYGTEAIYKLIVKDFPVRVDFN